MFQVSERLRPVEIEEAIDPLTSKKLVPRAPGIQRTTRAQVSADDLVCHRVEFSLMFALPATGFFLSVLGYFAVSRLFPRLGLLDFPERYGLKRGRIPYPAGIVALVIFLICLPFLTTLGLQEYGMITGILLLGITCFLDDRTPLPSWLRLLVQVIAAFLIFATGSRMYTITNPLGGFIKLDSWTVMTPLFGSLPVLSGVVTIGWLLLTINALNWFDGISGQVSVLSVIGFLMLGFLAEFRNDQLEVAIMAYTLAGIALAGVWFDFPPAKMLMGDTGSMFFGLMLGLLGVYQGGKVATAFLALGIPLLDAASVIIGRLMRGVSPLKGGRDHLHHRLLDAGYSERAIVIGTATLGTLFGATALFLDTKGKFIAALLLILLMVLVQLKLRKK